MHPIVSAPVAGKKALPGNVPYNPRERMAAHSLLGSR
jgi:hypothetical protein